MTKKNVKKDFSAEDKEAKRLLDSMGGFNRYEIESYHQYIREGKTKQAIKILMTDLSEEEAKIVVAYHKRETQKTFELVISSVEEITALFHDDDNKNHNEEFNEVYVYHPIQIVFNYKGQIKNGEVSQSTYDEAPMVWFDHEKMNLKQLSQIWLVKEA
jgi:hypothetical protein